MKGLILYYDPGAGGDFLISLLQSTGQFYTSCAGVDGVDATGKITIRPDPKYRKFFPAYPNNPWKGTDHRDWSEAKMQSLTDKPVVINTLQLSHIKTLRDKGCDWPILRISYEKNMYWFIKKCILTKLMNKSWWPRRDNPVVNYMIEQGKFATWMLKKHLKDPKNNYLLMKRTKEKVWKKDPPRWNILVDSLLVNDFSAIQELAVEKFDQQLITTWINAQQPMFTKRPMLPLELEKLFGYNKLLKPIDYPCPLDELDNIVIKFYYPDAPRFNNTQELFTYF